MATTMCGSDNVEMMMSHEIIFESYRDTNYE